MKLSNCSPACQTTTILNGSTGQFQDNLLRSNWLYQNRSECDLFLLNFSCHNNRQCSSCNILQSGSIVCITFCMRSVFLIVCLVTFKRYLIMFIHNSFQMNDSGEMHDAKMHEEDVSWAAINSRKNERHNCGIVVIKHAQNPRYN